MGWGKRPHGKNEKVSGIGQGIAREIPKRMIPLRGNPLFIKNLFVINM